MEGKDFTDERKIESDKLERLISQGNAAILAINEELGKLEGEQKSREVLFSGDVLDILSEGHAELVKILSEHKVKISRQLSLLEARKQILINMGKTKKDLRRDIEEREKRSSKVIADIFGECSYGRIGFKPKFCPDYWEEATNYLQE